MSGRGKRRRGKAREINRRFAAALQFRPMARLAFGCQSPAKRSFANSMACFRVKAI
jgi:hypothetical protein